MKIARLNLALFFTSQKKTNQNIFRPALLKIDCAIQQWNCKKQTRSQREKKENENNRWRNLKKGHTNMRTKNSRILEIPVTVAAGEWQKKLIATIFNFQWLQNKFSFHWNSVLDSRSPQFQTHAWATQIVATIVLIPSSDCNPFVWMRLFGLSLYFWDKKTDAHTQKQSLSFYLLFYLTHICKKI